MKRKKLALLTINPESEQATYVMNGVFAQCNAYGYDVAVISPMVHSSHYFKDYLEGELRIYDIVNFDLFDGVLITPVPMQEEQNTNLVERLLDKFKKECHVPVVAIDEQFGDYDIAYAGEVSGITTIASHIVKKHGCKNIAVLTGPKQVAVSDERLDIIKSYMASQGVELDDSRIVYGDFWYTSGENLAKDIIEGRFEKPEAVICTSDHMAIGLTNALIEGGIQVPGDIAVVGYGGTMEAAMNYPPVTTYEYDQGHNGASAVNRIVHLIEPEREIIPAAIAGEMNICLGTSCGCSENPNKMRNKLRGYLQSTNYAWDAETQTQGISLAEMTDSYISETFTSMDNVDDCIKKIYESLYLLKPYNRFYMCMNTDWLESKRFSNEYSREMNMVIYSDMAKKLHGYENHVFWGSNGLKTFDRNIMLPIFDDALAAQIPGLEDIVPGEDIFDEPQVYYFTPLHYGNVSMGYVVMQNPLTYPVRTTSVYRTYIRYINNALEMSRAKNIISNLSEHDQLTGLYNRRGMERAFIEWKEDTLMELKKHPEKEYNIMALVIDMNNLKIINDTEGHEAGDIGINVIAKAALMTCRGREITARGGGDEFYILGIGEYTEADGIDFINRFKKNIEIVNDSLGEVKYSAAAGYAIKSFAECDDYHAVLDEADVQMYVDKRASKKARYD